jgi:hypothetical protein
MNVRIPFMAPSQKASSDASALREAGVSDMVALLLR